MTSKKFRPRAPQQTGPTRNLRTMATPPSGAQNRKGAATDHSLTYVRAFRDIDRNAERASRECVHMQHESLQHEPL